MRYVCMMLACLLMVGCQEEEKWGTGATSGFRISLQDAAVGVETKSTPEELGEPLKTNFKIKVVKQSTGESETYNYKDNLVIPASAGTYDITASYGKNQALALDEPYYEGTAEDEEIKEDATEPVSVTIDCKVANALASVEFLTLDAEMKKKYDYYALKVTVENQSVELKSTEKRSAYFQDGATVSLSFVYTTKGGTGKEEQEFEDDKFTAEKGKHYIIKLKMEDDASMKIEKKEVEEVTINETIPMEWLPKPKIGGFNDDGATSLTYTETAEAIDAKLNFTASSAIQDIEFSFEFADTQEKFQALNNKTFSLQNMAAEDWALFNAAQITLPTLGESTKAGSFDFKTMTANLQTNAGAETVNKIKLRVKANDRWSSEEPVEYSIKTIAPKVTVTAKPEDIWSKELTVSGATVETGNEETILGDIKYQYNENGEWKDCTGTEGLLAKLKDHPSNAKMRVRAVYRDVVACGETEIELEKPEQLPNSDMEEWHTETYTGGRYTFNPWSSVGSGFWDTNNDFTTRHRHNSSGATMYNYNGFHAVSYVQGRDGNGLAAELRSTANGRGNTRWDIIITSHEEKNQNKVAGELFTGTYNVNITGNDINGDDSYERNKSASFSNRPTALHFYYKYIPYSSDSWSVHIELLDENKNIIIQNEKTSSTTQSNWSSTPFEVPLNYEEGKIYSKCEYIYVIFKSTTQEGANMPYREITQTFYVLENGALSSKTYEPAYVGSVLTIDDISLVYDK